MANDNVERIIRQGYSIAKGEKFLLEIDPSLKRFLNQGITLAEAAAKQLDNGVKPFQSQAEFEEADALLEQCEPGDQITDPEHLLLRDRVNSTLQKQVVNSFVELGRIRRSEEN